MNLSNGYGKNYISEEKNNMRYLLVLIFFAFFIFAICAQISLIGQAVKEDAKECLFTRDTAICLQLHRQAVRKEDANK